MCGASLDAIVVGEGMSPDAGVPSDPASDAASLSPIRQALSERLRLARELHDGLLQALTAAALQLETTIHLVETDPREARERIRELQQLIVEQQRGLRRWIDTVRKPHAARRETRKDLEAALTTLCNRTSRQGPPVQLTTTAVHALPARIAEHAYRVVEEALSNAVRHAQAKLVRVDVRSSNGAVRIVIADDGRGFPFRGRYDLRTLDALGIGPVSLRERIAFLDGRLMLESRHGGSTLAIALPMIEPAWAFPGRRRRAKLLP